MNDRASTRIREYLRNNFLNDEEDRKRLFDGASSDNRMSKVCVNLEDMTPTLNREDSKSLVDIGTLDSKHLNREEEGDARLH